jgi:uncharacterized protein YciI
MLFVVAGHFRPDCEAERAALEGRFNEHLMQRVDRVRFGGPLYGEAGAVSGVLLVVEAADHAAARAFLHASPYHQAGLYDRIEVSEIRPEIGGMR